MDVPACRAAAIFLFNHKYEKNVGKLEEMYAGRFPRRQYIMPFGTAGDPRVIPVFEGSWRFSGHVAQACGRIERDPAITHYAFIADDLIINPRFDEVSLLAALNLGRGEGFIKSLISADAVRYRWPWAGEVAMSISKHGRAFDWRSELPPAEQAQARFEAIGLRFPFPAPRSVREALFGLGGSIRWSSWNFLMGLGATGRRSQYPVLAGYSDFFVVPAEALDLFARYCGIFAAMNVFAEVAVPTALALAVDSIKTELPMGAYFMAPPPPCEGALRGVEFWATGEAEAFATQLGKDRERLEREFPEDWLYAHPVKLSQWR